MKDKLLPIVLFIIGFMLTFTGFLFKMKHWPDSFYGIYSGPILIILGIILLIIGKKQKR